MPIPLEAPDDRIRRLWALSLLGRMNDAGMSRRQLRDLLAGHGVDVTVRTIGLWVTGVTSPRPATQQALADVFGVTARTLFPLPRVEAA